MSAEVSLKKIEGKIRFGSSQSFILSRVSNYFSITRIEDQSREVARISSIFRDEEKIECAIFPNYYEMPFSLQERTELTEFARELEKVLNA